MEFFGRFGLYEVEGELDGAEKLPLQTLSNRLWAAFGIRRPDGNTAILINYVLSELRDEVIETELVQLAGTKIHGSIACYKCGENKSLARNH